MLEKQRVRRKWWNLIDFMNAVFFVIIVSTVINRLWISHFHEVNHLTDKFSRLHRAKSPAASNIDDIKYMHQVETFIEFTFVEVVLNLRWYNGQPFTVGPEPDGIRRYWTENGIHKPISKPIVRQVRVVPRECYSRFFNMSSCLQEWSFSQKDVETYGEKWQPATYMDVDKGHSPWAYDDRSHFLWWTNERFYGKYGRLYDISGYDTLIGPTVQDAHRVLEELEANGWQDWHTRACFVTTTVYNVNDQSFSEISTLFEYYVHGSLYNVIRVLLVSRVVLLSTWEVLFLFYAFYYVMRSAYLINHMGLLDYLKSINNVTRVIIVYLTFLAIAFWIVHHLTSIKYSEKFMNSEHSDFFEFDTFVGPFRRLKLVLSLLLCLAIARVFMCVRGGRSFLNAYYTFIISLSLLFWFILGLLVLIFLFKRLNYLLNCHEYMRTKELILSMNMTQFLNPSLLQNLNVRVFLLLRVLVMSFFRALFLLIYIYYSGVGRAYNVKPSDSFNLGLFILERIKLKIRNLKRR